MSIKFTSPGSMTLLTMPAALQTLAVDTASVCATALTNASRYLFQNFAFKLGTQTARTGPDQVSLVIVPVFGSIEGDVGGVGTGDELGTPYIATDKDGNKVTWTLDAAVTARVLTWANVCIPNGDYYVGILNETTQAFAGTNEVYTSSQFTIENAA